MSKGKKVPAIEIGPDLLDRFHEVQLWPGEDEALYKDMRTEMLLDFGQGSPIERSFVEKMIQLEWDTRRIRLMRDTMLMAEFKRRAADAYMLFKTDMQDVLGTNPEASRFARDLVHPDPKRHQPAREILAKMEVTQEELSTQAYLANPDQMDCLEAQIADAEVRMRRLLDDLLTLRADRAKVLPPDDWNKGDLL